MARHRRLDIRKLADSLEPGMRDAFLQSIADIKSSAQMAVIIGAIEEGRIDDAIKALNLTPEFFAPLDDAIRGAYLRGGRETLAALPLIPDPAGGRLAIRFDGRNPRAEAWIVRHSSNLIREIVTDQRQSVRTVIEAGMTAGKNPRSTALDLVGRVNRATKRREGGIIGLTEHQAGFVTNARSQLQSGDVSAMRAYLGRGQRDRRFDSLVKRAIAEGRPVGAKDVDRIMVRYSDRLLKVRGDTIARTESLGAFNAGQNEGLNQLVDTGAVRTEQVRRIWHTAHDSRVRDTHQALEGESVGVNERFSNGLKFPAEAGGPPGEVINCRCQAETRISFLEGLQ